MDRKISKLYRIFDGFKILNPQEIKYILSHYNVSSYQKGNIVIDVGQIAEKMLFIEEGVLREFSYNDQDSTITHWLISEGNFRFLVESFLEQTPSKIAVEAIERTKIWAISKTSLDKLYLQIPALNLIGRLMTEERLKKYEIYINILRHSPEERLAWFDTFNYELANRVPLKYIASYLNMRAETLSRIRHKQALKGE